MRKKRTYLALGSVLLFMMLALSGCGGSLSVQASASILVSPAPEPTDVIETLEPLPTEGPDPVATEYALAALETPTATPISRPTLDTLRALEAHATRPTVAPPPDRVNDLPFDSFIGMNSAVIDHVREIYAKGQMLGRNPAAFSKAGDSTIESPYFLGRFDSSPYHLGDYRYLQAVIDHFAGSYGRKSLAVRVGQHSWTLLNPAWADKKLCNADETPLACELRLNNPSVVILRLGANDSGVTKLFEKSMRAVVEYVIEQGVIPVLSTKPDQRTGTEQVNQILRQIADGLQDSTVGLCARSRNAAGARPGAGRRPLDRLLSARLHAAAGFTARPRRAEFNGPDCVGSDLAGAREALAWLWSLQIFSSDPQHGFARFPFIPFTILIPHEPFHPLEAGRGQRGIHQPDRLFSSPTARPRDAGHADRQINAQHAPRAACHLQRRFRAHRAVRVQRLRLTPNTRSLISLAYAMMPPRKYSELPGTLVNRWPIKPPVQLSAVASVRWCCNSNCPTTTSNGSLVIAH